MPSYTGGHPLILSALVSKSKADFPMPPRYGQTVEVASATSSYAHEDEREPISARKRKVATIGERRRVEDVSTPEFMREPFDYLADTE